MGTGPARRSSLLLCALLLSAGCSTARAPADAGPGATATPATPAPHSTSPQELCTSLITHWTAVILAGDPQAGLDYQAMGLSGGQNEILRDIVAAARAEQRTGGPDAARALTAREAERRCADRYRSGTPTGGPW
ncbi:hypothetical protein [Streptomyces antimicrobicus]|uniref:Lipoprotein n=1 Tax=Streptomyces antimicrobicus TaxID=2883108 RepID=A0ABS8BFF1_9ACTN|nr:hypothetical protein [Streptomyces antimicrobicus]MCB5183366.1 hypothetical protein [Streptomyces antimicrobicus]